METDVPESIAYDEQELVSLKYERDRIIENIARIEARLREKQQHLESLKATVTVDTTAESEAGTIIFGVNENIDLRGCYCELVHL